MTDKKTSSRKKTPRKMTQEQNSRLLQVAMKDAARKMNQNLEPGEEPFQLILEETPS